MAFALRSLAISVLSLLAAGSAVGTDVAAKVRVTPISKVLDLMGDLLKQCIAEKEDEAVKFSAFSQWCTDQTRIKNNEISDGKDTIAKQTAEIEKAKVQIAKLAARILELEEDNGRWEKDKTAATDVREKETADFKATSVDYMESIDALTGAIAVLKKQAYDREQAALVQTSLLQVSSLKLMPAKSKAILLSFLQQPDVKAMPDAELSYEAPEAYGYEFQSGGVVEMLEKLKVEFSTKKREMEAEELSTQHAYENMMQQLADNIELATNEISKKTEEKGATEKFKAETEAAKAAATADLEADEKYLADMTALCEVKTSDFNSRAELRAEEIETIKKAIEVMTSSAVTTAEEYLPSLLQRSSAHRAALAQLRSSEQSPELRAKMVAFLSERAKSSGSRLLSDLVQQVQANPFTKVKKMIKELIWKLTEESTEEMDNKGWCDTEVATNKMTRTKKTDEVAELTEEIEELEATIADLTQDIADLAAAIKELEAAMAETTAERMKDKAANEKTIAEAQAAQKAVQAGMAVLKDFYAKAGEATALAQQTPAEDAPVTFDKPYKGAQVLGGGNIVDFLEVILTDFTRLESETAAEEEKEVEAYKKYMHDSEMDKALKETEMSQKTDKKTDKEGELQSTKDLLKTTQTQLDQAMAYYEKLKPACIDSGIKYEDRVKRREEEMQSLQEALKILQGQDIA